MSSSKHTFIEASCTNNIHTRRKGFAAATFKGLRVVSFLFFLVHFRLFESFLNNVALILCDDEQEKLRK